MNPADIIARAAATVPSRGMPADGVHPLEGSPRQEPRFSPAPGQRQGELPLPSVHRRGAMQTPPAKGRWARRWQRHRTRVRRPLLLLLIAAILTSPLWLWQSDYVSRAGAWLGGVQTRMANNVRMTVDLVSIEGRRRADRRAVEKALGAGRGVSILNFDLEAAKARIESMPWVAGAVVERRLPDTIHVGLTERRPIARWRSGGRTLLVDGDGVVIRTRKPERWAALPLVAGGGAPAAVGRLLEILAAQPKLAKRVASSRRLGKRRWDIVFDNGVVLMLPDTNPAAAWRRFARLEAKHRLLGRGIIAIDLRLPDRIILRAPGALPVLPPRQDGTGRST